MQLSKLELVGFKSFADKTEFIFEPGVTAFVGPNGCGKSNVVDAVKWVLGEQSAKSLRGNEMIDVIYNGSNGHKSTGYAEASLTILNQKKLLAIDFEEVCVTRRLYRSGESEYLLNKQPCRLKDIRELFMDTGVGCDIYSVIEQGQVDRLVDANAKERRLVFEEAAGISRYKAKREESRRTLDRVKQRLEHVDHELEWVQKSLRSVQIQAGKARSYKEAQERLRELSIALALTEYLQHTTREEDIRRQIVVFGSRQQEAQTELSRIEAEQAEINVGAVDIERSLGAARTEESATNSQISAAEERIRSAEKRIAYLKERETSARADEEAARARAEEEQDDLARLQRLSEHFSKEIEEKTNKNNDLSAFLDQIVANCAGLEEQIEKRKAAVVDKTAAASGIRNEMTSLSARRAASEHAVGRLRQRQEDVSRGIEQAIAREDQLAREREELSRRIADIQEQLARKEQDRERVESTLLNIEGRLRREREEKVKCESRRALLEDIEARAVGIAEGVKAVLNEAAREGTSLAGVNGIVADFAKVALEHALAIDVALGDRAQHVVAETTDHATAAIAFLKAANSGRSGFLPLDRIAPTNGISAELLAQPGVIGRASDLVQSEEPRHRIFEHLLGDTLIVDNFATALRLSRNGGAKHRIVTIEGEKIEPAGAITGGTRPAGDLITRRSELASLEEQIATLEQAVALLEWERQQTLLNLARIRDEVEARRKQTEACNLERFAKENELKQWNERRQSLAEEHSINESEIEEIRAEMDEGRRREAELRNEIEKIDAERLQLQEEVGIGQQTLIEQREIRADAEREFRELQSALAALKSDQSNRLSRIASVERFISEHLSRAESAAAEVALCRQRQSEAEQEINSSRKLVEDLTLKQQEIASRIEQLKDEQAAMQQRREAIDASRREAQARLTEISGRLQEIQVQEAQCRAERIGLEQRIRGEYEVELNALTPDSIPPGFDPHAAKEETQKLLDKMRRLGPVNLAALDEQQQLQERFDFLTAQREDLRASEENLQNLIRRINRQSRELFMKTFETVREHFKILFRKLFGGGRADITLEEDPTEQTDPLEAGIEITAQPPGKAPSRISLLSGGERTMTTVALLFAIFKAKPSPFCILDEVDAALDDKNVDRFVGLLQDFLANSQFIVITHNKRTMSVADVLYGITMQDSGVSKRVAVKFQKEQAPVENHLNG